jgi:AraC-like DNA-binding protein
MIASIEPGVLAIPGQFLYNPRMPRKPACSNTQRDAFFMQIANPIDLLQLFEFLPEVYHYVKDRQGRYMRANRVVCRVVGVENDQEMLGKTDFDFFPPAIAAQYVDEDRRVIQSKAPLSDQIWLVPDSNGVPQIFLCNKVPLFDMSRKVVGIAGVKRPYKQGIDLASHHGQLMRVVEYVTANYRDAITVADLAEQATLSESQLHRQFGDRFGITPNRYIREVRIGVARHLLETEDYSMAKVANECGFYDQSHFSRQFKACTGLTPLQYRQRFNQSR